jgi:hypothetical protein
MCGAEMEDIRHFMLWCTELSGERMNIRQLQQPYEESENDVIGRFLFEKEELERKNGALARMWKLREWVMEKSNWR